jgi:DNA polymerase-3 subunit chi
LFSEGRKIQIAVDSTSAAQLIDQMLWTFSQSSFIPHAFAGPENRDIPDEPVLIVIGEKRLEGFDALLCDAPVGLEFLCLFETAIHFILRDT